MKAKKQMSQPEPQRASTKTKTPVHKQPNTKSQQPMGD